MTEESEIRRRLQGVMGAVFGIDASGIAASDSSATVAEWDSVGHLQFMLALEDEFGIRFEASELASLNSVSAIEERVKAGGSHG